MKLLFSLSFLFVGILYSHAQTDSLQTQPNADSFVVRTFPGDDYQRPDNPTKNREEWVGYMMPGGGYSVYRPARVDSLGLFHGPYAQFILFQNATEAYRGPGIFQFYMRLNILRSSNLAQRSVFNYNFGVNFSFESAPNRIAGIPFFGLEMGGWHQAGNRRSGTYCIAPTAGLYIIQTRRVCWYIQGGYNFAVRHFDEWSGVYGSMGINVQFW